MDKDFLLEMGTSGKTQREMASLAGCSQTTIRYWLQRHNIKTNTRHKFSGAKYETATCKVHGETTFIFEESRNSYRCRQCRSGRVSNKRREIKKTLVEVAGGKCVDCGYSKCLWALQFDHTTPENKIIDIAHLIRDRKLDLALEEIKKCDLVCANCHAEREQNRWVSRLRGHGARLKSSK